MITAIRCLLKFAARDFGDESGKTDSRAGRAGIPADAWLDLSLGFGKTLPPFGRLPGLGRA